jgi:hypothetical protein
MKIAELKELIESGHSFYKENRDKLKPALKLASRFLDLIADEKDSTARQILLDAARVAEGKEKEILEIAELDHSIDEVRDERMEGSTLETIREGMKGLGQILEVIAMAKVVI